MNPIHHAMKLAGLLTVAAAFCVTAQANNDAAKAPEDPNISHTVSYYKELVTVPAKRKIAVPNVGEFRVLKGDFHIHTVFSDGRVWPTERVIEADGNGLDVIAITDHIEYRPKLGGPDRRDKNGKLTNIRLRDENDNYNFSYELAKVEADKRKLLLIRGTEITRKTMPPGHFNALFIQDANKIAALQDDYREMFKEAVAQGAFLLWNHPGWQAPKSGGIEKGAPSVFTAEHEEIYKNGWMHGIEAFNGTEFYPVVPSWCTDRDLAVFANSDIHPPEFERYGVRNPKRPITLVLAREKTLDSVREAFFAKRTIGWAANMIFGQEKFVRPLFAACVEIKKENGDLVFSNRSSIPAKITAAGQTVNLPPLGQVKAGKANEVKIGGKTLTVASQTVIKGGASAKTITVENWLIGKNKPLTVSVE